jgi:CDP-diacylglycerol---glycerol-3-phosphate 3-phosphatidyltransferase
MEKFETKFEPQSLKQKRAILYLPSAVTSLRLFAFPFLISASGAGQIFYADLLFIFAISSDFLDGFMARKLRVSSKLGARLDAIVDFVFVSGMFFYFIEMGFYPMWILLLIAGMFGQFIITSALLRITYDQFGKYYGSLLYGAIGLTLLFSGQFAHNIIIVSLVGVTIVSIASRLLFALKRVKQKNFAHG